MANGRANWVWPGGVFLLFGVSLIVCTITVMLALSNETVAIEDNYYARAVAWDATAAELRRSEALGWSLDADLIEPASAGKAGPPSARFEIRDEVGEPIEGASMTALVFHHADRGSAVKLEASPTSEPGIYEIALPTERRGLWQFRLRTELAEDVFIKTVDLDTELPG